MYIYLPVNIPLSTILFVKNKHIDRKCVLWSKAVKIYLTHISDEYFLC